ncbi:tRNA (adenosine(37)-N6)-threonylcarbamoyltransferase complex dimerization subunit type 1 TsaB [Propionigenium maris DSM 9537]|uniref:tRNA (Adenosine(37)-N6)-threonylcarbamoyltransferase complex dimerization subunit type 1 TsaB n=1 Tax=Propionigenium maris DSM 9537 TaxID=1123000 RepID=A0A9W6GKU6_9FUSO|nr:tRNA (adenosine(37)-N6)-threonylcarbamoyltransferase complex dimerization subunit type 1 TsaB [Propionigenium maris]GLI56062.1 tRNA (adenosine(37)-N6)-threonylcarbamoyltransferase complex dimerization subunit type 1 TsaB [Propionigenium maris DSM 9537]
MLVLAINTSTKVGTVALYHSEKGLISEVNLNIKLNHSDTVMTSIDSLFQLSGYTIKDVERIAVSVGPGSFTGIRVGVGAAKGMAYSLNIPVVGINELDAIAHMTGATDKRIISMIDARKERVYYCDYSFDREGRVVRNSQYQDGEITKVVEEYAEDNLLFLGDASIVYRERLEELAGERGYFNLKSLSIPRASVMAEMAVDMTPDDLVHLEPYYHSKTQAERMKEAQNK